MSIKWFIPLLLLFLLITPAAAESAVTLQWVKDEINQVNNIEMSGAGEYVLISEYNNLTMYSAGGTEMWSTTQVGFITKIVFSPNAAYYASISEGGNITYGSGLTGTVIASYYYPNTSTSTEKALDIDITEAGTRLLIVTNSTLRMIDTTNATLGNVTFDYNAAGLTGGFKFGTIDPDGTYALGITDATGTEANKVKMFVYDNNTASSWYQSYLYRKSFVITSADDAYWYPVNISIYNTTGSSSGDIVYIGNRAEVDLDDIRFTTSDGVTRVNQWYRQQWSDHVNYSVVPSSLTSGTPTTFYMYFGNKSAARYSNVTNSTDETIASWGSVSNIVNFDAESTPGTGWSFENYSYYYGWTVPSYSTTWKTNGSTSRKIRGYASAGGGYAGYSIAFSNNTFTLNAITNPLYNKYNLSFTSKSDVPLWQKDTFDAWTRYAYHDVYINNTLVFSNHTDMSASASGSTYGPTEYGYVYLEPSTAYNFSMYSYTYAYSVSVSPYLYTNFYVDNLTLKYTGVVSSPPTVGSWGQIEGYSELEYTDQEALTGDVVAVDMPWNNAWLAVSTTSRLYDMYPSGGLLGAPNSLVTAVATPYDIAVSDTASYMIEGRGIVSTIYTQSLTSVGTHSAGNNINDVAISTQTGQWAISGSADGRAYVFSKYGSSTWEEYWASDTFEAVTASAFSTDGDYFAFGNTSGGLWFYETEPTEATTEEELGVFYPTLHITKNGVPYKNANVTLYNGDTAGTTFIYVRDGPSDSYGNFIWSAYPEYYYHIDVYTSAGVFEGHTTIYATSNILYYTLNIVEHVETAGRVSYNATWNNATQQIDIKYYDYGSRTDNLTIRIRDLDDKGIIKYEHEYVDDNDVEYSYSADHTHSYKVEFAFYRDGKMQYADPIILKTYRIEIPISKELRIILACIFLMFVAGLFGVADAGIGAFILCAVATAFYIFEILPIPGWLIPFAWVMAFLNMARKGGV